MGSTVRGLTINPNLTYAFAPKLTFEPSMGIMARKVDKLGMDIRSFRVPLERSIKEVMIPSFMANFAEQGRPDPWLELQPETIRRKGSDTILSGTTGALKRTMGYINTWTISTDSAYIQDLPGNVWYGKLHQAGYTTPSSDGGQEVEARPFIVAQDEDEDNIVKVFEKWLGERALAAGLVTTDIGIG